MARRPHRGSALVAPVVMADLAPFPSFGRLGSFLRDIVSLLQLHGPAQLRCCQSLISVPSWSLPCKTSTALGSGMPQQTAPCSTGHPSTGHLCCTPLQEDEMESMLSLFGTPGDRPARQGAALAPAARVPTIPVDIREDDKAIYVTADAPGLGKGDIKVSQGMTCYCGSGADVSKGSYGHAGS